MSDTEGQRWFRAFAAATPEEQRVMLEERKAEESRAFLASVRGPEAAQEWLDGRDRLAGPPPPDLDAL